MVKNPPANARDAGDTVSIPGLGRFPGKGNGNPLQCSCLGNPTDTGAWWGTVHGVARLGHNLTTETNTQYRLDTIQERISELWDISIETSKTEKKRKENPRTVENQK